MEDKIRRYVAYQFRFNTQGDKEEVIAEVSANIIDRYHALLEKGIDEESAYIEAIQSMGDFSSNEQSKILDIYNIRPSLSDIMLLSGAILSFFGLLLLYFSDVTGGIVTALSILLFSGAAYYLYSYVQYVMKMEMDVETHNLSLIKIIKYLKTCFGFWMISLSILITKIIVGIIIPIYLVNIPTGTGPVIQAPFIYGIVYLIVFAVLLIFFYLLYRRILHRFYLQTGIKNVKSKLYEGYQGIYGKSDKSLPHKVFFYPHLIAILSLFFYVLVLLLPITIDYHAYLVLDRSGMLLTNLSLFSKEWYVYLPLIITLLLGFVLSVTNISKREIKDWMILLADSLVCVAASFMPLLFLTISGTLALLYNFTIIIDIVLLFWIIFGLRFYFTHFKKTNQK